MDNTLTVAIYTCAFPPKLQCGGGCALRYYTIVKNLLADGCKVLLFTVHPSHQVIAFDPIFKAAASQQRFIVQQIPSMTNKLYPQISLINPKWKFFQLAYRLLKEHKVRLLISPDTAETLLILHLAKLAGVQYTIYGIHTDLFKLIGNRPGIMNKVFMLPLFFHHIAASHSADNTSVSSRAFWDQIQHTLEWKYVKIDGCFESYLWSEHFKLPDQSEEAELYRWRCKLTQGQPSAPLLLYAGRWSHEKRIELLPQALPKGWKLALIGDGPDADSEDVLRLRNEDVFAERGFLDAQELSRAYQCADFFISASDFETFGFCVLEALACGTPVAVEHAGGFVENVEHGENGLLLNYEKSEETEEWLRAYSPGSSIYQVLKENVRKNAAKENLSENGCCFTERLVRRHVPGLLIDSGRSSAEGFALICIRWIYVLLTFFLLNLCAVLFC